MTADHVEIERTFAVGPDQTLPDLTAVPGVGAVTEPEEHELVATYVDTADLALLRAGVTLRRREGGPDQGWHLKLPTPGSGHGRREIHLDLDTPGLPPSELGRLVLGWTRAEALAPVAELRTRRTVRRLLGDDGAVLAEVVDDQVQGVELTGGVDPVGWREWEVELVHGRPRLLDRVERLLGEHGVAPARVQRKIAMVLASGHTAPEPRPTPTRRRPARLVVHRRLEELAAELAHCDPVVRRGAPGGVHRTRKACRRLRALLGTFRPLLDREVTDPVREELRWLARSLGDARDHEVVMGRLAALVEAQPDELVVGPVRSRLSATRAGRLSADEQELRAVLDSPRYFELRDALDRMVAAPPWTARAERPARAVLPARVARDWQRMVDRHRDQTDPHEVRKAAKRLRYAAETLRPLWGSDANRLRRAARDLTEVLGERQDTVVARDLLIELAAQATAAGESAFTWGRLHAQEQARAAALDAAADRAWRQATRRRTRGWLTSD